MPFGKKTNPESQEQFALVLNPVRGELSKTRMIERMTQVFPLAVDEASDLVDNTPIILLEGLDRELGEQVRTYFSETGANLILTDDHGYMKRCFRAVWPSPPKFDFLGGTKQPAETNESVQPQNEKALLSTIEDLQEKKPNVEIAPEILEIKNDAPSPLSSESHELNDEWHQKKIDELESSTTNAILEEKIADLAREKGQLERLLLSLQRENDELKSEQLRAIKLEKELQSAQAAIAGLDSDKARLQDDLRALQESKDREMQMLTDQIAQIQRERADVVQQKDNQIESMQASLDRSDLRFREERAKNDAQTADLRAALQSRKLELDQTSEGLKAALEKLKLYEGELSRFRNETSSLRAEHNELKRISAESQHGFAQQKKEWEMNRVHLEDKAREAGAEAEAWRKKAEEWIALHAKAVRDLEEAQQKHAADVEGTLARNRELQVQLEVAQKQIRDFAHIAEQQDILNKRNRLTTQLADKEMKLREVTLRQGQLKEQLAELQRNFDLITVEREAVEQEILKDKQGHKHLLEQLKLKEKSRAQSSERLIRIRGKELPIDSESEKKAEANG